MATGTAHYGDIELAVEYDFDAAEPPIFEAWGGGHPGSPAQAYITAAWHPADPAKTDLLPILDADVVEAMEEQLATALETA